jgi:hypothetical protein
MEDERRPTMTATFLHEITVHVFFAGREFQIDAGEVMIDHLDDDRQLRRAMARYLGVELARLRDHVVVRHKDGDITLRPRSVFD